MDKIIIKNLRLRGILGVNPEERVEKQDLLINLVVYTDISNAAKSDSTEDAINYKCLKERVIQHVEESSDFLIERLVTDIARILLTEYSGVERVKVRVEKPNALRFAESVGVEIERTLADFKD